MILDDCSLIFAPNIEKNTFTLNFGENISWTSSIAISWKLYIIKIKSKSVYLSIEFFL